MNEYNIKDRVYCINKEDHRIDCGIIKQIIIEENNTINYRLELIGYNSYYDLIVEEKLIGKTPEELYQKLRDNIKEYFPLHWR